MDPTITVFQPDNTADQWTLWIALCVALAGLAGMILLLRRPAAGIPRRYGLLGAMLLFFVFLIASATAFFSFWSARKTGPVRLYADAIETPYGRAAFADIRNAYIEEEKEKSFINPNIVTGSVKLLIIEEYDGKAHVLSEEHYPLPRIMDSLREAIGKWREANPG